MFLGQGAAPRKLPIEQRPSRHTCRPQAFEQVPQLSRWLDRSRQEPSQQVVPARLTAHVAGATSHCPLASHDAGFSPTHIEALGRQATHRPLRQTGDAAPQSASAPHAGRLATSATAVGVKKILPVSPGGLPFKVT